jgi:hypothetical protein
MLDFFQIFMFFLINSCINFELHFWDSNLNELKLIPWIFLKQYLFFKLVILFFSYNSY